MLEREKLRREVVEFINTEERMPQNHLLRKIDAAVDFCNIYDFVEDLYCADNGRPSVDPVVLFKIVLIQHLYGIRSLRQTLQDIDMNIAYRWFLGYTLNESLPHFSTVSYNFKHRFTEETVSKIFEWILKEYENDRQQ
jgi:transposase